MMQRYGRQRWLLLLPVFIFAVVIVLSFLLFSQRPPVPVGDFVLPERLSGRPLQALYRVDVIAVQEGWTPELQRLAGDLWREAGDITRALPYWQAAAQANADQTLLRDIALAALEVQDWAQASDALSRLSALAPDDAWTQFQLGLIQMVVNPTAAAEHLAAAGRESAYAPAAAELIDVLPTSSDDAAALVSIGQVLANYELWSFAELAFTTAAQRQPIPEALAYTGFSRDMQSKDGSQWIERAVALAPESATVRLLQGLHLRRAGDYEGSARALSFAAALEPENPVMYAELGAAHQLLGDMEQARRWLGQAVALSGGDPRFQDMLDSLTSAEQQLLQTLGVTVEATDDATAEPIP
jgi:Flp pilus assembly protein TadD